MKKDNNNAIQRVVRKRLRRVAGEEQQILTVPQSTALTGFTERATWQAIYRKRLPFRKLGAKTVILREDLEKFWKTLPGVSVEEAVEKAEIEGGK